MTCENYVKLKFQCAHIKFYQDIVMLTHGCTIQDSFHMTMAEMGTYNRDRMTCKA